MVDLETLALVAASVLGPVAAVALDRYLSRRATLDLVDLAVRYQNLSDRDRAALVDGFHGTELRIFRFSQLYGLGVGLMLGIGIVDFLTYPAVAGSFPVFVALVGGFVLFLIGMAGLIHIQSHRPR